METDPLPADVVEPRKPLDLVDRAREVRLIPWDAADLDEVRAMLACSYEDPGLGWALYGCATVADIVEHNRATIDAHQGAYWLVEQDSRMVGFIGASLYRGEPGTLGTATYLCPTVRRSGLNARLKDLIARACAAADVPLIASVAVDNDRSNAAMRRLLNLNPPYELTEEWWRNPSPVAYLYRFPATYTDESPWWAPEVVTAIAKHFSSAVDLPRT